MNFFVYNSPTQLSLLLYKKSPFSFTGVGLVSSLLKLHSLNYSSLLLQNKPVLLVKKWPFYCFRLTYTEVSRRSREDLPATPRLVSKQVPQLKEPTGLTTFLPTWQFEGKFSSWIRAPLFLQLSRLYLGASLVVSDGKASPVMQEPWVRSPGQEDPLEKKMATHSSILAWRIPCTEEPGGLQSWESMGGINPATWASVLCAGFFRTKPAGFGSTPSVSELFLYFIVFLFYNLKVTFFKLSKQFPWWAFSHGRRISRHGFFVSFLHKLHKKPNLFLRQQFCKL